MGIHCARKGRLEVRAPDEAVLLRRSGFPWWQVVRPGDGQRRAAESVVPAAARTTKPGVAPRCHQPFPHPRSLPMLKFFEAVFDALALVVNIIDRTSSR